VRILLDECVNAGIKEALPGHEVSTVSEIGWRTSKDGPLLAFAHTRFDVFITVDRNLPYQQNVKVLKMGVIVVRVQSNQIDSYKPVLAVLQKVIKTVQPGEVIVVNPLQL